MLFMNNNMIVCRSTFCVEFGLKSVYVQGSCVFVCVRVCINVVSLRFGDQDHKITIKAKAQQRSGSERLLFLPLNLLYFALNFY